MQDETHGSSPKRQKRRQFFPTNCLFFAVIMISCSPAYDSSQAFVAELPKAPSRAPFLRNFGKLIKPRKFGYDVAVRASERANAVRTDSGGGGEELRGDANWGTEECHLFMAGFLKKRKLVSICHVNK